MSKMKEHLKQVKKYLKEEYFGIPNTTEKSNLSEKVKNKDLENVLDGFQSDHIVMASIGHYSDRYEVSKIYEIIGYYDQENQKIINIKTGQVYEVLPIKDYKYVCDVNVMNQIEIGKDYARSISPINHDLMNSFPHTRRFEFKDRQSIYDTLFNPYRKFLEVTNNEQNLEYFNDPKNQVEYFIKNCVFDVRMYKENNVDYLSDDRYRMSKYNYLDDTINQRCYLYYEAGNLYAKDLNSGLVTQVRFPGQVYKSMPEQFIYDLNSVDSHSLTQQEKENIYKEYFEICGRLQNQEKVYKKK